MLGNDAEKFSAKVMDFSSFVNEHLPSFMVFYDDEENLGAAKASVYTDGGMIIYLFVQIFKKEK